MIPTGVTVVAFGKSKIGDISVDILGVVNFGELPLATKDLVLEVGSVAVSLLTKVSGCLDLTDEVCFGDNLDD